MPSTSSVRAASSNTEERPPDAEQSNCPDCGGDVVTSETDREQVCEDCGLVVDEDVLDRGPDWRSFDDDSEKSRVGRPATQTMHDKGLSTTIGQQNRDAYGNQLSSRKRKRMNRLRRWDERYRTQDHSDRNLKHALGEISRMSSALGVPDHVQETASVIYRRALDEDLIRGRSIEGVATAALYAACRQQAPRSIREFEPVTRVDIDRVKRAHRHINREMRLELPPPDPEKHIPRYASQLGFGQQTAEQAVELLEAVKAANKHSSKDPVGLAAGALYGAQLLTNDEATQQDVSDVTGVSKVTIRNRYQMIFDCNDIPLLTS